MSTPTERPLRLRSPQAVAERASARRRPPAATLLVVSAALAAIAIRVWILASPLGTLESDEAITGLIARHALDGEFTPLYWLSLYGGTQEALLTALVFAVTGSSVLVLKLTALAVFVAAGAVLWFVGRRTVGARAAWLGLALFSLSPAYFVWWTTKARAYYGTGLLCELLVLLLVLRLRERDSRRDALALGFVLGFGVWATYQFLLLGLPALVWLAWRRPGAYRLAPIAVPAFLAGSAPWLAWNATHGWAAVYPRAVAGEDTTYVERFADLFAVTLPTWLGVRVPFSLEWLPGRAVGVAITVVAVAGFAALLVRRPRRLELLLVAGAAYPFLYAASSFTYFTAEPRYLVFLAPLTALLLGALAARWRAAALTIVPLVLALSIAGLVRMEREGLSQPPGEMGPLIELLEREGATRVLAGYWIAYRLSFESGERIVATSTDFVRYEPHDRLVRRSPFPARVFRAGSPAELRARTRLEARGYVRRRADVFSVYIHPRAG